MYVYLSKKLYVYAHKHPKQWRISCKIPAHLANVYFTFMLLNENSVSFQQSSWTQINLKYS